MSKGFGTGGVEAGRILLVYPYLLLLYGWPWANQAEIFRVCWGQDSYMVRNKSRNKFHETTYLDFRQSLFRILLPI